jgi:hypothetical protein
VGFGFKCEPPSFNYIDRLHPHVGDKTSLIKQMADSYQLAVDLKYMGIEELKLTNQNILTWEDYWVDESNALVDPQIKSLNLQKNSLVSFNANLRREHLEKINVESNPSLVGFIVSDSPNLTQINLSNCYNLANINLGNNSKIKALVARNCNLTGQAQERLLRDFKPTLSSGPSEEFSMFRKNYETLLDLRGSIIDWGNRRVASKIRLLVCNNWLVLWDNPPPTSIIPPQMYSFFTFNLEDELIKKYYS